MAGPFIYIGTYTIKSDKLEETRKHLQELVDLVETSEPRLIAFNVFLDEQGKKVSVVQVHPDAASMASHMKVVSEHMGSAFDYLEKTEGSEVYGTPPAGLVEGEREWVEPSALRLMPIHVGGFTRTNAR